MNSFVVELLIRLVVFVAVFAVAARRHPKISIRPKFAMPLVGLVFALLNLGLYWGVKSLVGIVTLGFGGLLLPLVVNGLFLWVTAKILRPLRVQGIGPYVYLACLLTLAHGALYLGFCYFG